MNVFSFLSSAQIRDVQARTRLADVTSAVQAAINSNPRELFFPPGDYAVTPGRAGYALLVNSLTIEMSGSDATIAMASKGNHQALRMERCASSSIRDLRFEGSGTNGSNGGQGLVQIYLGSDFIAAGCTFDNANCDGLAVAAVRGVQITGCSSHNASKGALYVNNSTRVHVSDNIATNFGGHLIGGRVVGVGLQLSGNKGLVAERNIIKYGLGAGILCDNSHTNIPQNNVLNHNVVEAVSNPTNSEISSGIRLTNTYSLKDCRTELNGNTVRRCSLYSFYIENHNGVILRNNVGIESAESNFVFSWVYGAVLQNNTAVNTNVSRKQGQSAFFILNNSDMINGNGNKAIAINGFIPTAGASRVIDRTGNHNRVHLTEH